MHSFTWIKKTTNLTKYKLTNKDDMNYTTSSKVFVFSWHQYSLKCVRAETSLLHSENLRRWHLWITHAGLSSLGHTARRMRLFETSDMHTNTLTLHTYTSVGRHCIIYRFTLLFTATIKGRQVGSKWGTEEWMKVQEANVMRKLLETGGCIWKRQQGSWQQAIEVIPEVLWKENERRP